MTEAGGSHHEGWSPRTSDGVAAEAAEGHVQKGENVPSARRPGTRVKVLIQWSQMSPSRFATRKSGYSRDKRPDCVQGIRFLLQIAFTSRFVWMTWSLSRANGDGSRRSR